MTRRDLLFLPAAGPALGQLPAALEPQNRSFSLSSVEGPVTPAGMFFVRDHFSEPEMSLSAWRLKIEGRVSRPLDLSLADLIESPVKQLEALLECAGNAAGGSAVSNARWEGVPVSYLLDRAGAEHDASSVLLEGADHGRLMPGSPDLPYCRLVPIAKCRRPESMVAFKLNDRFLPRQNGFPARALLPGWYGMDSVKWLRRMVVLGPSERADCFYSSGMSKLYNRALQSPGGDMTFTPVSEIRVKSAIAWPPDHAKLPIGRHVVRGFAWTGAGLVRTVSFSADGGRTWVPAQLEPRPRAFCWVRWQCAWTAFRGDHLLLSRAIDDAGGQQPLSRDSSRRDGYELNFCAGVRCSVR